MTKKRKTNWPIAIHELTNLIIIHLPSLKPRRLKEVNIYAIYLTQGHLKSEAM